MNLTKHSLAAGALTITLTLAGASVASAGDGDGAGSKVDREARITKICENPDEALAKIAARQTHLTERIARQTEMRSTASDAGRTKLVARIDHRLEKLQRTLERVSGRVDMAPAWIAEHCT